MDNYLNKKILLGILPYWDPLIPPSGIATIKAYLIQQGFNNVKTIDFVVLEEFKDLYNKYFQILEECIPIENRGNFYNMGHNVYQDHMMAYINHNDENEYEYIEFLKDIIYTEFYINVNIANTKKLDEIIKITFEKLHDRIKLLINREKPDVFGLSAYKGTLPASIFAFKLVKKINPRILTVMGGSVFSTTLTEDSPNYDMILNETESYIDKIIIGEGEILFADLLSNKLPKNQRVFSIKKMDYLPLDLSETVVPDYSDFNLKLYPYMPATGSVSCPFKCSFCNATVYWGKYRKKNPIETVDQMVELYDTYKNQLFYMSDSTINPIINELAQEFIDRNISLYYDCFFRVDKASCDIKNTLFWRKGGLYRVRIGVESGSQKILDLMEKNIELERIKDSITALAYAGIKTTTYWVIGHPGETEDDFEKTLELLEYLKNDIYQAEPTPIEYVYSGQNNSQDWESARRLKLPKELSEKYLKSYNWVLDSDPKRDIVINRINRFNNFAKEIGIPNPYSLDEHFKADQRWQKLHKNSTPALIDFFNRASYIDENKNIEIERGVPKEREYIGDFKF